VRVAFLVAAVSPPRRSAVEGRTDITIGASVFALILSWGLDPAIADTTGTPLWGCLLFSVGVAIVDAGHTAQERRARRPPQGGNGA